MNELIGVGLYTPAEAGRLLKVSPGKITRWLRGHRIGARNYAPLWTSEVDIDDGHTYLGFRDLMEVRVADAFIKELGISPQSVRTAIQMAAGILGSDHPLSMDRFRTDGREIFLTVIDTDEHGQERERLLNLFRRQYEFRQVIEPILKTVDFDHGGAPFRWWPNDRKAGIVIDPTRAFGQPIDSETSVPTSILATAGRALGLKNAAQAYDVPKASVTRAMKFESLMETRAAA